MHQTLITPALVAAICAAASFWLTAVVRAHALRHAVIDLPNERSSHTVPTPRGGGLAVVVVVGAGTLAGETLGLVHAREALAVIVGMAAVAAVGWRDDKRSVGAVKRLGVHAAAGLWALIVLGGLPSVRVGNASIWLGLVGYPLGIVGIVWSINLFNFMDGIDGLAGSQSVLIFGAAALLLYAEGSASLGFLSTVLAAASAGFLAWNWPPAKIFMGDVGSGAIGYVVAAVAIASEDRHAMPLLAFAVLGGVFVVDATVTLVRRKARGDHMAAAHRDHAYQRLTRAWGSHRSVTMASAALTAVLAAIAAFATWNPPALLWSVAISYVALGALLVVIERRHPMSTERIRRR